MKNLIVALFSLVSISSALATGALAQDAIVVNLSKKFADRSVQMKKANSFPNAIILDLPFDAQEKAVLSWTDQSQCLNVTFKPLPSKKTERYFVEVDYNWDDGLNSCLIQIQLGNGKTATLDLYYFITD